MPLSRVSFDKLQESIITLHRCVLKNPTPFRGIMDLCSFEDAGAGFSAKMSCCVIQSFELSNSVPLDLIFLEHRAAWAVRGFGDKYPDYPDYMYLFIIGQDDPNRVYTQVSKYFGDFDESIPGMYNFLIALKTKVAQAFFEPAKKQLNSDLLTIALLEQEFPLLFQKVETTAGTS